MKNSRENNKKPARTQALLLQVLELTSSHKIELVARLNHLADIMQSLARQSGAGGIRWTMAGSTRGLRHPWVS